MITDATLNVNYECNFRCPWCYAESTNYDKNKIMSINLAKDIIDFLENIGVTNIDIIGGEPTYYKHLIELIEYIKNKNKFTISLTTNGYKLSDMSFLKALIKAGLDTITFSIKYPNEKKLSEITSDGKDAFDKINQAIANVSSCTQIRTFFTYLINKVSVPYIYEAAKLVANTGKNFNLSFCRPTFDSNGAKYESYALSPDKYVEIILDMYDELNTIMNGKLFIQQSLPLCAWPDEFICKLCERNQLYKSCNIKDCQCLIFDVDGKLLLCNQWMDFPVSQFKKDFNNLQELNEIWFGQPLDNLRKKILSYPFDKCKSCDFTDNCIGGCPLIWLDRNLGTMF